MKLKEVTQDQNIFLKVTVVKHLAKSQLLARKLLQILTSCLALNGKPEFAN